MNKSANLLLFIVIFLGCLLNCNNIIAQAQNNAETISITPVQYERWVQNSGKNLMSIVNSIVDLSDDQKTKIINDFRNMSDSPNARPDLNAINGRIIARESFKMISNRLTQAQNDQLTIFNTIKN